MAASMIRRAFIPRPPLFQDGLEDPAQKKRPPNVGVALVKQQVAVELAVGPGKFFDCQAQHRSGLFDVAKGRDFARQLVQPLR